jgi:hypothetical protein
MSLPQQSLDGTVYSSNGITVVQYANRYHLYHKDTVRDWDFKTLVEQQAAWESVLDFIEQTKQTKQINTTETVPSAAVEPILSGKAVWGGLVQVMKKATRGVVRWTAMFPLNGWSRAFDTQEEAIDTADQWYNNHIQFQQRLQEEDGSDADVDKEPPPSLVEMFGGGDVETHGL